MKQQILFIHGGEAYSDYENYLEHLRTVPIDDPLEQKESGRKWKQWLKEELSQTHDIFMPRMPNSANAKYDEWKIWFERYFEFLQDGVILIGHSQGGYFLVKYLSENTFPFKLKALYLLAAPFENIDFGGEDGGDFEFNPENLPNLAKQTEFVYILHSEDDFVVPYEHALKYKNAIEKAELVTFEDKNHFLDEDFVEIRDSLLKL